VLGPGVERRPDGRRRTGPAYLVPQVLAYAQVAGLPGGGRTVIGEQSGARSQLGTEHLFPTNSTAVAAFRLAEGTEQVDTRRCRTSHSGATVRP